MKKLINLVWNIAPENLESQSVPEDFKGELAETIKSFIRYTSQLLDKLKVEPCEIHKEDLRDRLQKIKTELETNAPYFLNVYEASIDRMIRNARAKLGNNNV